MKRKTQIICTLGPSSSTREVIARMAQEGMDIARLNFSHGTQEEHHQRIDLIRAINTSGKNKIKILQDLQGYRIRTGFLAVPLELKKGDIIRMGSAAASPPEALPLDADFGLDQLKEGMDIFIADGTIALKVLAREGALVRLEVLQGGVVGSKKGVNIPELKLKSDILTEKDRQDIAFGMAHGVDFVAQSFVRNRQDIVRVAKLVKAQRPSCQVIAKIENREGVRNVASILAACDGIMVARGDLGVSLPIYEVPMIQKDIIRLCNRKKKLDITATQMLESMTEHFRPTRAEVSDVANAILDGSDGVMLSGETAVGRFPVETVRMMRQIIEYTEKRMNAHKGRGR